MQYRMATIEDVPLLARMNRHLVQDERHRNAAITLAELEQRMRGFLAGDYTGVLFEAGGETVAYALFRDEGDTIHLRQFFVRRDRRREGIGREAMRILDRQIWPADKRISVGVLCHNEVGRAFWHAVGFRDYALELELPAANRSR